MAGAITRFKDWRIKPSAKLPIFLRCMIHRSFHRDIAKKVGIKNCLENRVFVNHMMYWPAKEYDAFEAEIMGYLEKNDGWIDEYCKGEIAKAEDLYKLGLEYKKIDWSKKKPEDFKQAIDRVLQKYYLIAAPWYAQHPIDVYFEKTIEEHLADYIKPDSPDFRKFVLIFTDPQDMTEVAEERWKLMQLAKKFKDNDEDIDNLSDKATKDLEKHLAKFAYINRGLATSEPYVMGDMVDRIKETWEGGEDLDKLIHHSSPDKIKEDLEWALEQIKPKDDFKQVIEQARFHSYARNRRVEAFFMCDYGASYLYKEIVGRVGFNPSWAMEITDKEMYAAIDGAKLPDDAEMNRRFDNYAMIVEKAETTLITDPDKIAELAKTYNVEIEEVSEVKGNMACLGGIIKGKAKVCLDKKEIGKVERGDILIAQFTTPDFVPAMEKAAAIVADQGGLSSHAAIVSRELGVPCVIGTKNGSRVIKDNDMLEIDAQTGVVKIIEKAK